MSEQAAAPAAPAAAPASAPSNGAPAPSSAAEMPRVVHAGDGPEDFFAQIQARAKALQDQQPKRIDQPPAPPKTVNTPGDQTPEQTPEDPAAEQQTQQQQQPEGQWTQEDIDLLAKAKEWMASDKMPEEFLQRLVELKNGEDVEYESWDQVRKERMMQKDYTRGMQEFDRVIAEKDAHLGAYQQHFEAIFNDANDGADGADAMYEVFSRKGKFKQLWKLGEKLAGIEQQLIDGANGMGYAIMQRLKIKDPQHHDVQSAIKAEYERRRGELEREAHTRAIEFENQRLKQSQQQNQQQSKNQEYWDAQRKSLEQLRPRAFEALGLDHENPKHRVKFDGYLDAVIRHEKANKVTPEIVMKAARAAMQELREELKNGGEPPKPKPKPFQPQVGAGGGKAPAANGQVPRNADEIAEKYGFPRW